MQLQKFSRVEISLFDDFALQLGEGQSGFMPLLDLPFSIENLKNQIQRKSSFPKSRRANLLSALKSQYEKAGIPIPERANLLMQENCFTICTGHQLNLLTGPLYSIFKIVHVIALSERLAKEYPEFHFLPVFWMASEDHDLDEIDHFHVGSKKIKWQTKQAGAVGRMHLEHWDDWQKEFLNIFPGNENQIKEILASYTGETLSIAARRLIHHLFSKHGLIILDGDDKLLKKQFAPIIQRELAESFSSKAEKLSTPILLEKGLKVQAFAREINMFLLGDNSRERIEMSENGFQVGDRFFTKTELLDLSENSPESFSPNVILRPLYQEYCLPNLSYTGGSGELAYWLQLKPVFEEAKEVFPLLQLRFSGQFTSKKLLEKLEKFNFTFPEFSQDLQQLFKQYVSRNSERVAIPSLLSGSLNEIERTILSQAESLDKTLEVSAKAHYRKIENVIQAFEKKLVRAEKRKLRDEIDRLVELHEKFFPQGKLQERKENFISAYMDSKGVLIDLLLRDLDPIKDQYLLISID